jgi:oligopeptide/dipeptide ABC transporter ATP-binding protein
VTDLSTQDDPLLRIRDLIVGFETDDGLVRAVDGVSLDVPRGRTLGIVGESGCGKTVTAFSVMRLLPQPQGRILGGQILFEGLDLAQASPEEMQRVRGARIGIVFQEPLSALNPVQTIGRQLAEVFLLHATKDKRDALVRSVDMLRRVGIPSPEVRVGEFPHQLSGGMRQRVVIAMALACRPALLIADEPTTALDVTIQAQILELMRELQREMGMAIVLITHDLGVIAETCDEVAVMYAGRIAEQGSVDDIFSRPAHPYTRGLLASIPRLTTPRKSRLATIEGMVPGLNELPSGCRFRNRCPYAQPACAEGVPPLETVGEGFKEGAVREGAVGVGAARQGGHQVSCIRWRELGPMETGARP